MKFKTFKEFVNEKRSEIANMLDIDPSEFEDSSDLGDMADELSDDMEVSSHYEDAAEYLVEVYKKQFPDEYAANFTGDLFYNKTKHGVISDIADNILDKLKKGELIDVYNDEEYPIEIEAFEIEWGIEVSNLKDYIVRELLSDFKSIKESKKHENEKNYDLFDKYEDQPKKLKNLLAKYEDELINGMNYDELADLLKEVNKLGYTFDYGLDASPYGLRKIGTPLNKLVGYEDVTGYDEEKIIESKNLSKSDLKKYFNLATSKDGSDLKDFEKLEKTIFGSHVSPDILKALRKYKTADDFAEYVLNRDSEILFPSDKAWKSDKEMLNWKKTNGKK